jgi:transcriptional regulator with XRE-family HTH domain
MPRLLPSYLHTLRKQSGLSQPEMAALFDVTGSAMSRFENLSRHPTIELLIGAEVIFGQTAKDVFPALYQDIERDIIERARALRDDLKSKTDPGSRKKFRLLNELIKRANAHKPAV